MSPPAPRTRSACWPGSGDFALPRTHPGARPAHPPWAEPPLGQRGPLVRHGLRRSRPSASALSRISSVRGAGRGGPRRTCWDKMPCAAFSRARGLAPPRPLQGAGPGTAGLGRRGARAGNPWALDTSALGCSAPGLGSLRGVRGQQQWPRRPEQNGLAVCPMRLLVSRPPGVLATTTCEEGLRS